ncbi:MAG: hypothetical protein UT30_C0032G0007 [Candidatus Uhrbacteria bacterium GW2011_GWF2_39_13]|uniref:Uncharacterized protein n=1 Tax=Candidatus Uhrbacteria bacterium GW2011_GWF2_39_13 TaxID=1618995 RepID=A0A0G0MJK9_9BACT|nr:MAG: hypothetical protein UT30_C0032G0007 [Candidatus Uhrbacteria bacterium GW2011_GWF2_39_13]
MKNISKKVPSKNGILYIYPVIYNGKTTKVNIDGNPDGLRYLANLLNYVADLEQGKMALPDGERFHIHLKAGNELGWHSSEVEICRADAKGTGELPQYMDQG